MSKTLHSVREDQRVEAAFDLMREKKISRVVVTDRYGALVGLLSLKDAAVVGSDGKHTAEVHKALRSRVASSKATVL